MASAGAHRHARPDCQVRPVFLQGVLVFDGNDVVVAGEAEHVDALVVPVGNLEVDGIPLGVESGLPLRRKY